MQLRTVDLNTLCIVFTRTIAISLPLFSNLITLQTSNAEPSRSQFSKLDQLAYFQGNWLCQVQDIGTTNAELAGKITWNVVKANDGKKYHVQGDYIRDRESYKKISMQGLMWYDKASARLVQIVATDDGSNLIFNSIGWQAKTLTWQGVQAMAQGDYLLRRTITKTSDRTFEAIYSGFDPTTSRWQSVTKLSCKK